MPASEASSQKGKDAKDKDQKEKDAKKEVPPALTPEEQFTKDLDTQIENVIKGVVAKDKAVLNRTLRFLSSFRRRNSAHPQVFANLLKKYLPELSGPLDARFVALGVDTGVTAEAVPEVTAFLHLLNLVLVIDRKYFQPAFDYSSALVAGPSSFLGSHNRRTLDPFSAKLFYYFALSAERVGQLAAVRAQLITLHRTAALQHNEPGQAVLTNCILRSFLESSLYAQADKFRLNTTFPESRSNAEHARYLYYTGKIQALQLAYSDALASLQQALRKAPAGAANGAAAASESAAAAAAAPAAGADEKGKDKKDKDSSPLPLARTLSSSSSLVRPPPPAPVGKGLGFRVSASQLLVIVQLLMGELPERALFVQTGLKKPLRRYLQLARAVRAGSMSAFNAVVQESQSDFIKDQTYSLIMRLRHNVIKAGLRAITVSYSRISVQDICARLGLENEVDAEFIIAKAITDGVIDASLDRASHTLVSKENPDVYSTQEPQQAFHKRIRFCHELHNSAVKALRFPPNAHKHAPGDAAMDEDVEKDEEDVEPEMDDK